MVFSACFGVLGGSTAVFGIKKKGLRFLTGGTQDADPLESLRMIISCVGQPQVLIGAVFCLKGLKILKGENNVYRCLATGS